MNPPRLPLITIGPSRRLALILGGAHLGVLAVLAVLPIALWMQVCGAALLLLSAVLTIAHHALRRGGAVTALEFSDREQVRVQMHDAAWHAGRVLGTSTVGTMLTVLNIRLDVRRWPVHVLILGDSMDAEDYRRLRVWLRWGPRPVTADPSAP